MRLFLVNIVSLASGNLSLILSIFKFEDEIFFNSTGLTQRFSYILFFVYVIMLKGFYRIL